VLTVLVPWGVKQYSSGTAQAVMDFADPGARLIFSCGWHISLDGKDVYSWPQSPPYITCRSTSSKGSFQAALALY
jgi:hypothetical protein